MLSINSFFSLLRIKHWSKNVFVLLGVLYTDQTGFWPKALAVALIFSFISSAIYIYNDICDIAEDKLHPFKKNRPFASGKVSFTVAKLILVFLFCITFIGAFFISSTLIIILATYVIINFLYNHKLRRVLVLDVLCIASGFMLRVLAGTVGIGLSITWWLTITATLLSLLIALSKRKLEMNLLLEEKSRVVLKKYSSKLLEYLIFVTAIISFVFYFLYVLDHHPYLYFILTLPFAAFGLYRFCSLVTVNVNCDDPITLFFGDKLSYINLICFFVLTLIGLHQ